MFLLMTLHLSLVLTTSVSIFFTLSDLQPLLLVGNPFTCSKYSLRVSLGLSESRLPWMGILHKGVEPARLFVQGLCAVISMLSDRIRV